MLNIKIDSRKIKPGDTFVAIRGIELDGHDYIKEAINNGATKIIAEEGQYTVETLIVPNTKEYLAKYLKSTYQEQLKDINFIGVTGTNGKTTTCYLIYKLLNILGHKTAYIGTIGFYLNDTETPLANTTPGITDLYEMFLSCAAKGIKNIIVEVSSHALELNRVGQIMFDAVAFTNLTQEHMDFHLTMGNYSNSKQKLFKQLKPTGYAVINGDDDYYTDFILPENKNIILGFNEKADYKIIDYKLEFDKSTFEFTHQDKTYKTTINLPGKYNIRNFLTALIIVNQMGYSIETILESVDLLQAPPGRMDSIKYKDSLIIIDYAHTPDAVLNVLNAATAFKKGKIITVVGCGGNRDKIKRPIMGDIATKLSDYVIFSNDNPITEDEKAIMNDITKDLKQTNYEIIYDREKAVEKAIDMLDQKDMLFLLGKGHETYQIIGNERIPYNDRETAIKYIANK